MVYFIMYLVLSFFVVCLVYWLTEKICRITYGSSIKRKLMYGALWILSYVVILLFTLQLGHVALPAAYCVIVLLLKLLSSISLTRCLASGAVMLVMSFVIGLPISIYAMLLFI